MSDKTWNKHNNQTHEELKLDAFIEKRVEKDHISIPDELNDRILDRIDRVYEGKNQGTFKRRAAQILAAGLLLFMVFAGSVRLVPGFHAYASDIPFVGVAVDWIKGDSGTEHAREMGYQEMPGFAIEEKGYEFKFDNIIIDEDRMIMSVTARGEKITDYLAERNQFDHKPRDSQNKRDHLGVNVEFLDFKDPGAVISYEYDHEDYDTIKAKVEKSFDQGELKDFLSQNPSHFKLSASLERHSDEGRTALVTVEDIKMDFDQEKIMVSEHFMIDGKMEIPHGKLHIKGVTISPTRMKVDITTEMDEDYFLVGFDDMYLRDGDGNYYGQEGTTARGIMEDRSYYFVPSVYFDLDMVDELYFGFDNVQVGSKDEMDYTFSVEDAYPQTIEYMGEEIIIKNVSSTGKLSMEVPRNLTVHYIELDGKRPRSTSITQSDEFDYAPKSFMFDSDKQDAFNYSFTGAGYKFNHQEEFRLPLQGD